MSSQPSLILPGALKTAGTALPFDKKAKVAQATDRIDIIDAVRGIAILGVLLVSVNAFGRPGAYFSNFTLDNESGINYYVWWFINAFFTGSMRALFSLLFGTSTILLLYRLERRDKTLFPADIYYRRMLILLGFAMINGFVLLWYGDILFSYAICGLFLFPFRNLKSKLLLIIGVTLILLPAMKESYNLHKLRQLRTKGELAIQVEGQGTALNSEQKQSKKLWQEYAAAGEGKKQKIEKEKTGMLRGYVAIAKDNVKRTISAHTDHFYSEGFLDVIPFFFIGMALFKLGILTGERSRRFYWIMAVSGIGSGLLIAYHMLNGYIKADFDSSLYADYIGADLFQLKRLFLALGYIGLIMLFFKYKLAEGLFKILSKVGQMTLTNYMMQAAICAVIFYGFGFSLYGSLERYQLYYVVAAVWAFQILFSNIWMKNFRYGPVEWVWRCLTYWKLQPIKK